MFLFFDFSNYIQLLEEVVAFFYFGVYICSYFVVRYTLCIGEKLERNYLKAKENKIIVNFCFPIIVISFLSVSVALFVV
jgi:hypothetical protein